MNLPELFEKNIAEHHLFSKKDKLLLAVSGGVDSVVLCELCKQAGYEFAIAHCNFQLRGEESDRDEVFVKNLAARYGVDFYFKKFDTIAEAKTRKQSIETCARELRYAWFEELRRKMEDDSRPEPGTRYQAYILTAHHANDNIETLLMNFFRGTGIKGLHGILPRHDKLIRPLLFATKAVVEQFAKENQLAFVTDHTNAENEFTRNYFRNELIPSIQKIFPQAQENLLQNIEKFRQAEELYRQAVEWHKKKLLEYKANEVHIPVLKLLKTKPLDTIVYEIIRDYGFTAAQTAEAVNLLHSETGKYILSSTHRILHNRKWLIISPLQDQQPVNIIIEQSDAAVSFPAGTLQLRMVKATETELTPDASIAYLDAASVTFPLLLRKWKQGDYFYPLGMQKKKKLSRFFIDQKLSLAAKEQTWVLESNKKICWVVGMRIDDRMKVTPHTKDILSIRFKPA